MVWIWKNLCSVLVEVVVIEVGVVLFYYFEGLLYNVLVDKFVGSYGDMFVNVYNWLVIEVDKIQLVCVNWQYYLLCDNVLICWVLV